MHKKLCIFHGIFAALCGILFLLSMFLNRTYFESVAFDSVFSCQLRQLAALSLLFVMGLLFLLAVRTSLSSGWTVLFAMPVGICLWVFASMLLLLTGIPYTLFLTLALIGLLLASLYLLRQHVPAFKTVSALSPVQGIQESAHLLLFFLGLMFLTASGFVYSFVSYDSFFYFVNYGHTLTILGNFRDIVGENSFTLTNISQFLPLVHSYMSFWGLDQAYQIQAFLTLNILTAFFCVLRQCTLEILAQDKKAVLYAGLFTLLLASSTSFLVASSWVLANMYCMTYIFFLFLPSLIGTVLPGRGTEKEDRRDNLLLIGIFFTALALLRKDGIIFAAFFLICFCSIELFSRRQLALLFLPASLAELWWLFYVRVILNAGVTQASLTSIANNKNVFFILLIIAASYFYIAWGHSILLWISDRLPRFCTPYAVMLFGMCCLMGAAFLKKADIIIDNVDFVIRNMFRYPSSWGISALFFGVLIVFSIVRGPFLDYFHFLWAGYALLNLASYCLVDSKAFWVNWDDSYNRVLQQILPVFVFIMALKSLALLQSDRPDHSSES